MTAAQTEDSGCARFTYRCRVSSGAERSLLAEWDRCRWTWNECVAKAKQTHEWNKNRPEGAEKHTGGPSQLDTMMTAARKSTPWLAEGASGRTVRLVHPAHTTMDCAHCGARAKHRMPLGERTYTCAHCGTSSPRDKNSAAVMLVRAGWNPAGADGVRPLGPQARAAA